MFKKLVIIMLLALPMGVFAQAQKFGHVNSADVISLMPEYTKAIDDLEAMKKQFTDELTRTQEEFNRKYQEFQQAMASESLPQNIAERRQKELEDMMQRQQQFQEEASMQMQRAQQEKMVPVYKRLNDAIAAVGQAEGVVYVFDLARTDIPYVSTASIDLTAKLKAQLGLK